MTGLLFFMVLLIQLVTVYLDNKTNMHDFFVRVQKGTVASAYTNRGITLTIARTLFYVVPPLLGYIILNASHAEMKQLILAAGFINLLITLFQSIKYCDVFEKKLFSEMLVLKPIYFQLDFYVGILAFMFFLITPYLLNYFALIFPGQGLWIVQLNAVVNSFLTLYVIWIFEPRIAKKIDKKNDYQDEFFEAIFVRLYGRLIAFVLIVPLILLF